MSTDDEFGRLATWTVEAVEALGPEVAVPAACRGSGGEPALAWLTEWLARGPDGPMVDVGAGLGGPAAWRFGRDRTRALLVEPSAEAAAGGRRLFGLPATRAGAEALPIGDGAARQVWSLGVLCTLPDHDAAVAELARISAPGAHLGLVVYVTEDAPLHEPEGNHFPAWPDLRALLDRHGLDVAEAVALDDLGPTGDWDEVSDAVDRWIDDHHGDDPVRRRAKDTEDEVARLLDDGRVQGRAVRLSRGGSVGT